MFEPYLFLPEKLWRFWSLSFAVLLSKIRLLHLQKPENFDAWVYIIRSFLKYCDYWKYLDKYFVTVFSKHNRLDCDPDVWFI